RPAWRGCGHPASPGAGRPRAGTRAPARGAVRAPRRESRHPCRLLRGCSGRIGAMDPTTFGGPIAPEAAAVTADRVAVCRLAPTYAFGIDSRDEALVRSVFT